MDVEKSGSREIIIGPDVQSGDVMPRQNRVTPFGEIVATAARGTLMGNRGCLHNEYGEIRRQYQLKRWIICLLDFKNRHRPIMTPGHYTELFFLDEATALAAGHRPCAECQRERFNVFRKSFAQANPILGTTRPTAPAIDEQLHQERITTDRMKRTYVSSITDLPTGTIVELVGDSNAYLIQKNNLLRWTPFGYEKIIGHPASTSVHVLTPRSIVRALTAGYKAAIHPSASK